MTTRRRRIALTVGLVAPLVLLLVGGAVGYAVATTRLTAGSYSGAEGLASKTTPLDGEISATVFADGSHFAVMQAVRNKGRMPITITDVTRRGGPAQVELVGLTTRGDMRSRDRHTDARLGAGDDVGLVLRATMRPCGQYAPGSAVIWTHVDVTYEVLGITRRSSVGLETPVEISFPAGLQGRRC